MARPKRPGRSQRKAERATGRTPGSSREQQGAAAAPIAGVVVRRGKYLEIEPLFQPGTALLITREGLKASPGDLVLYAYSHGRRGRVLEVVGKKGVLRDVLSALLADTLVQRGFGSRVLAEAAEASALEQRHDTYRADVRDLFTFTVDPEEAQDFDDALSFLPGEDGEGTRVFVHIADVSYFVHENGAVDREALRRGTSVYVPGGAEPMLPALLSSNVCSLQPGVDRKAVTVEMELDKSGRVRQARFYRSSIRSDRRMDYEELESIFRGERLPGADLEAALAYGRPLAQRLRQNRLDRGSLRITSTEPEFHWEDDGQVAAAHPSEELESHHFIEEFMILANEQVAGYLEREHVPTVYRVHEPPDPFRVDYLFDLLSSLDVPTPVFDPLAATPPEVRRAVNSALDLIDSVVLKGRGRAALEMQVLRAQSRAVYRTENLGHFGLASTSYCHFTSPIRRYPDLLVHRGLLGRLGLGPEPATSTLEEWAEHCSRMEREAAKVELKADDIALAHLLRRRLGEEGWDQVFGGQILSFVRSGAFVLFDRLFQGFLPARELPGDYYELDDLESALVGRRTGAAYRLADLVDVRVSAVDEARGRVDLSLAGD